MPEKEKTYKVSVQIDEDRQKLLEMSQIGILLDNYDDIFSDFDPRHYSQRSLSDDFLSEAKKVSRDKQSDKLELDFLVPKALRDLKMEATIKKRLRDHFNKHMHQLHTEIKTKRAKAAVLALTGMLMMLAATYIYSYEAGGFFSRFLFVLMEPTGWFMTWFAFDQFFYANEIKKTEFDFYRKMSKCEIGFSSY